jgi:hypothetical protein
MKQMQNYVSANYRFRVFLKLPIVNYVYEISRAARLSPVSHPEF